MDNSSSSSSNSSSSSSSSSLVVVIIVVAVHKHIQCISDGYSNISHLQFVSGSRR